MTKHEEQCFAACFQLSQGMIHQTSADLEALTVGTNGKRSEHRGGQSLSTLLFDPNSGEDNVPYGSTRIFGKPLP